MPPPNLARSAGPGPGQPRSVGPGPGGLPWLGQSGNRGAALSAPRRRLRRMVRRIRRGLAVVLALGALGAMVFAGLLLITPSVADAPSRVRALDLKHGVPYPGPAVPQSFAAALAAAQGRVPGQRAGFSPVAVGGMVLGHLTGLAGGRKTTLSRYLARTLYEPGRAGPMAGAEVDLLAVKLDLTYPARRILQLYADAAYFGHGWYGLSAASCGYFGTPPRRLSRAQAAMLARLLTAPSPAPRPPALRGGRLSRHQRAHRARACGTR